MTARSKRTDWHYNTDTQELLFGLRRNVIMKNLVDPKRSRVFNTEVAEDITAVFGVGDLVAFGNSKGLLKVIKWLPDENKWKSMVNAMAAGDAIT
jgi:hypothetical protein